MELPIRDNNSTLTRRDGAKVYVVARVNSTSGRYVPFPDGHVRRQDGDYVYTCNCGDLAHTKGHYTSLADAWREADALNRAEV